MVTPDKSAKSPPRRLFISIFRNSQYHVIVHGLPASELWIYASVCPLDLRRTFTASNERAWSRSSVSAWPVAATSADSLLRHVFASELSRLAGLFVPFSTIGKL